MAIKTYTNLNLSLSANFTVKEFACKHCSKVKIDDSLITYLQKIRSHFGKAITINSGYRCATHNKAVGGATNSYHTKGQAADIVVADTKPEEVAKYAESIGIKGIGLYNTTKDGYFVHIDTRTSVSYWKGQAQTKVSTFGGKATTSSLVKEFQQAAKKDGFAVSIDSIYGPKTQAVAQKAILYKTKWPWRLKNLTKFLQKQLGIAQDGKFGASTKSAVIAYQKKHGLTADGRIGINSWKKLLGV